MAHDKALCANAGDLAQSPVPVNREVEHFDSLMAFFAPQPMLPANRELWERGLREHDTDGRHSARYKGSKWYGVDDANAVIEAIEGGWPEGAKRMAELSDRIAQTTTAQSIRRVRKLGDHGDEYDVNRSLAGAHDRAWSRRVRGLRRSTRGVTIVLNAAASYRVQSEAMFWRGAAALCLSDLLTDAGYAVTLMVAGSLHGLQKGRGDGRYQYAVTVKHSHQPLDAESLAAATALAGFFRLGGFRKAYERAYPVNSHVGHPDRIDLKALDAENPVVAPESIEGIEQAEAWLRKTIESITRGEELAA